MPGIASAHLGRLGGARLLTRAVLMAARYLIPMYVVAVLMGAVLMGSMLQAIDATR
ncbi:MAG: hypothetical protein ACYTHJ_09220 [Planctomycetota bacterium]|jgi:hypothetical protein